MSVLFVVWLLSANLESLVGIVVFQVQPFASLVKKVGADVPRLLINRDPVGQSSVMSDFESDSESDADSESSANSCLKWSSSTLRVWPVTMMA